MTGEITVTPDLRTLAEKAEAAMRARHVEFACSCGGRRWVDDENWQGDGRTERTQHDGLIPCGSCNFGGWDTPENEPAAPSCDHCEDHWPCDAARLLATLDRERETRAGIDVERLADLVSVHVHELCPPDRHIEWIDRAAALDAATEPSSEKTT